MTALAAFCGALPALLTLVIEWLKLGQAQTAGAKLQAAATTAVTAQAETAIAAAEVAAPQSRAAVVDQLKAGSF